MVSHSRTYLPKSFSASDAVQVREILNQLILQNPESPQEAHHWFSLFCETSSAVSELHTQLELAVHLNTKDKDAENKLEHFETHILSQLLSSRQTLISVYLNSPFQKDMHSEDPSRLIKDFKLREKHSGPALTQLQLAEAQLVRKYKSFMAQASCNFMGRNTSLSVLVGKLSNPTETIRKEAFFCYWGYIQKHENSLQKIFDEIFENRNKQAQAAGCESYIPIAFTDLGRIDYGTEECRNLCESILQSVVPILAETEKKLKKVGTRPWDIGFSSQLSPRRLPATGDIDSILKAAHRIVTKIHPVAGHLFETMRTRSAIQVHPAHGKAPGAFCVTFQESGMPFVFGNFSGSYRDAITLLHEFGHALHGHLAHPIKNILLRTPGMEFCEFAALGMEVLSETHFSEYWDADDEKKAIASQAYGRLNFWPFMAMMDCWQHKVYTEIPDAKGRNAIWKNLSKSYRPFVNWEGCEEFEELGWFSRPHLFTSPFYYIDYGIAQLGALQLQENLCVSYENTAEQYLHSLSLGNTKSLKELFEAAGLHYDFSAEHCKKLACSLERKILLASKNT